MGSFSVVIHFHLVGSFHTLIHFFILMDSLGFVIHFRSLGSFYSLIYFRTLGSFHGVIHPHSPSDVVGVTFQAYLRPYNSSSLEVAACAGIIKRGS